LHNTPAQVSSTANWHWSFLKYDVDYLIYDYYSINVRKIFKVLSSDHDIITLYSNGWITWFVLLLKYFFLKKKLF